MAKGVKTTVKDHGEKRIRALIAELSATPGGPHVKAGVLESAGTEDGVKLSDIALWNEFGTQTIPERPFMRTAAQELVEPMRSLASKLLVRMIEGKTSLDQALDIMGLRVVAAIKRKITEGPWVPNAPSTVAKKAAKRPLNSSQPAARPLIDSGQMRNSVNYEKVK